MSDENKPKQDGEELTAEQLEQAAGGYSFGASNPATVGSLRDSASGQATGRFMDYTDDAAKVKGTKP